MTRPVPPGDLELLRLAARWWAELAVALDEVGRQVGRLSDQLSRDWPDDRGQEWAERTAGLGRRVLREAVGAAQLGAACARRMAEAGYDGVEPGSTSGLGADRRAGRDQGMRLGGTEGSPTGDERGMRIAELSERCAGQ